MVAFPLFIAPRTRLAGIPFERRTIPRSSALEKTANRDSIKSKVFEEERVGFGEGEEKLSPESFSSPSPIPQERSYPPMAVMRR